MRKKLELLLDKHYENYRFSDPLHGETKDYVLDAMEEALTLYVVGSTFAMEFAQYIAKEHYVLVNVLYGWHHWQDEYGIKNTQELLKDFKKSKE